MNHVEKATKKHF